MTRFHQLFTGERPACPSAPNRVLLAATLQHNFRSFKNRFSGTLEYLRQSFHVDDLVVGADNLQTVQQIYSEAKTILADAGMKIRKWASNSSLLAGKFRTDQLSLEDDGGDPHTTKIQGPLCTKGAASLPLPKDVGCLSSLDWGSWRQGAALRRRQVLRHLLADNADQTTVMMIDVNSSEKDMIARQELEEYAQHHDTFSIRHVLSRPPTSEDMVDYVPGLLKLEVMTEHLPPPNSGTMVLCCGPPRFIAGICEPALRKTGHKPNLVLCF
ncbi:hypothetical protein MRX96_049611 [Rhipicephalus microplus]